MATKVQVETKHEIPRRQCSRSGRTRFYLILMKEPWRSVFNLLWQEYDGVVVCAKCSLGTRAV